MLHLQAEYHIYRLVLAVYSDGSFDWHSALVQHNGGLHSSTDIEFIQFQSRRNFDMEDIRTGEHTHIVMWDYKCTYLITQVVECSTKWELFV